MIGSALCQASIHRLADSVFHTSDSDNMNLNSFDLKCGEIARQLSLCIGVDPASFAGGGDGNGGRIGATFLILTEAQLPDS